MPIKCLHAQKIREILQPCASCESRVSAAEERLSPQRLPADHGSAAPGGWAVNHKRVARIRREDNLLCVPKLSFRPPPTDSRHGWRMWPNLARHPVPMAVNQLWVADITLGSSPRACLYKAARRVRLSGCCAGCIQPARGWLGDGGAFASRAGAGCVGHGDWQSQRDARRAGPSLGSRRAICLRRIHCPS
jgi:hypothetical protein